jgi:plastocyanin
MGLYITPDAAVPDGCAPLPGDVRVTRIPGPATPPRFHMPLGRPPGATVMLGRDAAIDVARDAFTPANVAVRAGTVVRWRFWDDALHNVTLADGPLGFSSPNLSDVRTFAQRLTRPGVYRLVCSLHAVTMVATVTVLAR